MGQEAVRWNIRVSRDTDIALRTFLDARGMKRGDLSRFIEEAVRVQVFHQKIQEIKARNAGIGPAQLQSVIDETVRQVRRNKHSASSKS